MTQEEYNDLLTFKNMQGSALIPESANAIEFLEQLKMNDIVVFKNVTPRDLAFHRCYFLVLKETWGYLPLNFKKRIPLKGFYKWLKIYQGKYTINYTFKNGAQDIEVDSISFGKMNNQKFKDYVKEQLPVLYEILKTMLPDVYANSAIETIEENFEKMFAKL